MGEEKGPLETGEFQATVLNALEGIKSDVRDTQDAIEDTQESVRKLDKNTSVTLGKVQTELETLKERGEEDREKRDTQVEGLHQRINEISSNQSKQEGELISHIEDANRHSGETPGKGGAAKTVGLAAGGAAGGGVLFVLIDLLRQWLSTH